MTLSGELLEIAKQYGIWTPNEAQLMIKREFFSTLPVDEQAKIYRLSHSSFSFVPSTRPKFDTFAQRGGLNKKTKKRKV